MAIQDWLVHECGELEPTWATWYLNDDPLALYELGMIKMAIHAPVSRDF